MTSAHPFIARPSIAVTEDLDAGAGPDLAHDPRAVADKPLVGKAVAIVHPAWHSCGSHQVFLSQARAYRALGAQVWAIALNDVPAMADSRQRRDYLDKTKDLVTDRRDWATMSPLSLFDRQFAKALFRRLRGDQATLRVAVAARTPVPVSVDGLKAIDLVHCNHFFCMPVAMRLAARSAAPIILDSHDVQARQYRLANTSGWTLPPKISYESMLEIELEWMAAADLVVHLNKAEAAYFGGRLPQKTQALLYPTIARVAWQPNGGDFLIVAAANHANGQGVEWLLREVAPLVPDIPFRIVGSVRDELQRRAPRLLEQHAALFAERVDEIWKAYETAAAVVLPTISGHGISIKTIEALSSGAPIVATTHAFRGIEVDLVSLPNVRIADDAASFAAALRATSADVRRAGVGISSKPHPLYDSLFSADAYQTGLASLVAPLLALRDVKTRSP